MVWFQCEDCGENLKKPKLSSHFRNCYATKLSCIDCGQMFSQDTVQGHNQCITEAEKYGPKGQVKPSNGTTTNTKSANQKPDVDINVGLSDRPPWYCSLCKTNATSKQALLLHADGKKHRGKARGFHAANQASKQAEVPASTENISSKNNTEESLQENKDVNVKRTEITTEGTVVHERKRKLEETDNVVSQERKACDTFVETCNGEVIQAAASKCDKTESNDVKSLKWKKLITATLKTGPNEGLKMRKLKKLVIKALKEAGATINEDELNSSLEHKINSSSRIEIVGKYVRLAPKK